MLDVGYFSTIGAFVVICVTSPWAMDRFPEPALAGRIWDRYFVSGGKTAEAPFRDLPMYTAAPRVERQALAVLAGFVGFGAAYVRELEARSIRDALAATGGNKLAASRLLGISRATLYEKLGK